MKEGDTISINIPEHKLDVLIDEAEFERRRRDMALKPKKEIGGYLGRYMRYVSSAEQGAVVK